MAFQKGRAKTGGREAPEMLDFAQKTLNKDSAQQLKPKTTSKAYTGVGGILKKS